ncbi:MAG: hypothetical protein EHM47_00795 [Ignavibacteriales bacterium]|nr:MAG: hypothetical protein EHM47_00795 [Ignavibacteriales bacterium]
MTENQEELQTGIGTEEAITLKPATVKITGVIFEEVGIKKSKKLVCTVKHPDNKELIHISAVKYENKGKLEVSGLWKNVDDKGLIRKGSALAVFLNSAGAKVPQELIGKDVVTTQEDKGYLCFKAY